MIALIITYFFLLTFPENIHTQKNADLSVKIIGFSNNTGSCYVALYRPEDSFPSFNKQYISRISEINNKSVHITFDRLPKGDYAIAVFHDSNNNGRLDKNLMGIPTEKYGFSNNARETFSATAFYKARIHLDSRKEILIIIK